MITFEDQQEYVVVHCGNVEEHGGGDLYFAMTREFYDRTKRTGESWHCPAGHRRVWKGKTTEQQLTEAQARETALRDQLTAAVHDAERVRKVLLRDRQRFANGVCPCCNRSFENVRRHMRGEHPDYDVTKVASSALPEFKCSCGRSFESLRGLGIHQGHHRRPGWDKPNVSRWSSHLTDVGAR